MGRQGLEYSPDKSSRSSRKRGGADDDSRPGQSEWVWSHDNHTHFTGKVAKTEATKIDHFFSPRRKDVYVQSELTLLSLTSLEARAGEEATLLQQVHSCITRLPSSQWPLSQ